MSQKQTEPYVGLRSWFTVKCGALAGDAWIVAHHRVGHGALDFPHRGPILGSNARTIVRKILLVRTHDEHRLDGTNRDAQLSKPGTLFVRRRNERHVAVLVVHHPAGGAVRAVALLIPLTDTLVAREKEQKLHVDGVERPKGEGRQGKTHVHLGKMCRKNIADIWEKMKRATIRR